MERTKDFDKYQLILSDNFGSRKFIVAAIGLTLGVLAALPVRSTYFFDDAYIHARVARNFIAFGRPVFNPSSDIIKIDSSTGFVVLVAGVSRWLDYESAIRLIEFISITVTITSLVMLVSASSGSIYAKTLAALGIIPYFLFAAYGGMETPLVCMFLVLASLAYCLQLHRLVLMFVALTTVFRFEAFLLLALLLIYYFGLKRVNSKNVPSLWPVLVIVAMDTYFFGSLVPHAAKVKSIAYDLPILKSLYNSISFASGDIGLLLGFFMTLYFILYLVGLKRARFEFFYEDIYRLFSLGILIAWVLGRSLIFPWYFCLFFFPFGLSKLGGAKELRAGEISDHRSLNLLLNGTFAVVILLVFGLSIHALLTTFGPSPTENSSQRVIRYRDIGAMLSKECSDCTLLTSEIGGLGFSFSGTVYDAFGLGDNQAVRFHPMKVPEERSTYYVGAIPVGYVEFRDPDLIVSMPVFSEAFRKSSLPSRYFKYECPISADRRTQIFGDTIIEIFSKRELSANGLAAAKCFF